MTVERIYFNVPGHYGTGPDFELYEEARAYAAGTIQRIGGIEGESYTRAFVDVRARTVTEFSTTDEVVFRSEVFLSDAEKLLATSTQ